MIYLWFKLDKKNGQKLLLFYQFVLGGVTFVLKSSNRHIAYHIKTTIRTIRTNVRIKIVIKINRMIVSQTNFITTIIRIIIIC